MPPIRILTKDLHRLSVELRAEVRESRRAKRRNRPDRAERVRGREERGHFARAEAAALEAGKPVAALDVPLDKPLDEASPEELRRELARRVRAHAAAHPDPSYRAPRIVRRSR